MRTRIIMSLIVFATLSLVVNAAEMWGRVSWVYDGDTLRVTDDDTGKDFTIRLWAIDAPESGQFYSKESAEFLKKVSFGQKCRVRFYKVDPFRRLAGDVYIKTQDGKEESLCEVMLQNGLAWHYKAFDKSKEYSQLEETAKEKRLGIWQDDSHIPPWTWRRQNKIYQGDSVLGKPPKQKKSTRK